MQHKNLSKGDKVRIRGFFGDTFEGLVWDVKDDCVLACSDRQYQWLENGDGDAAPIGFPWCDIIALTDDRHKH